MEILILLRSQFLDCYPHCVQFQACNLLIYLGWHRMDLIIQLITMFHDVAHSKRLIRKAHVHNLWRMPERRCEVDKPPFGKNIYAIAVCERVLHHILLHLAYPDRN